MYYPKTVLVFLVLLYSCMSAFAQPAPTQAMTRPAGINSYSARQMDSLLMISQLNSNIAFPKNNGFMPAPSRPTGNGMKVAAVGFRRATTPSVPVAGNSAGPVSNANNRFCSVISGRDFLQQDSLILWSRNPSMLPDGNVIVSGEYGDFAIQPYINAGAFCMKTTPDGKMIWGVLLDSADQRHDYMNLAFSLPLKNGDILLAGRTRNPIYKNDDLVIARLDGNGNLLWLKTYQSRFWQGFNGSGDFMKFADLDEDPVTGDIYFTGNHWFGNTFVAKFSGATGNVTWSRTYRQYNTDSPFGLELKDSSMVLFTLSYNNNNDQYINILTLKKSTGDTIATKRMWEIRQYMDPAVYSTWNSCRLDNGHYLLPGATTRSWEFPVYTGTVDLYHASVVELDENFNFVKSYGFKNRIESNMYNTRVTHFPDGSGVFTMMKYISGYTAQSHISLVQNDTIYHSRMRNHINEGLPYEPPCLQLPDGGILNAKLMGDSTIQSTDGTHIDFYRMHTSDTSSACMGVPDTTTKLWYRTFEPLNWNLLDSVTNNVFFESLPKTYTVYRFGSHQEPGCVITSNCDSLNLSMNQPVVCLGSTAQLKLFRNSGCGSFVPLQYDTLAIKQMGSTDSSYSLQFNMAGVFTIYGSIQGCSIIKDSLQVTVLPAPGPVNLGADTSICTGNSLVLHAGNQYATYSWQDGSTDSVLTVSTPGIYHVQVTDACGNRYHDTLTVAPANFVFSIGPDRIKCNSDTVLLSATAGFSNYRWEPDYFLSSVAGPDVSVNPLLDTFYYASAEKWPGCIVRDTVFIKVNQSPVISLGADTSLCAGQSLLLDAGTGFTSYAWSTGAASAGITVNQPAMYTILATAANGCRSADTLQLLPAKPLPVFSLGSDATLCSGEQLQLQFNLPQATYQWQNGSSSNTFTITQPGLYSLQVTQQGCSTRDSILIAYKPAPVVQLGKDSLLCEGQSLLLDAGNAGATYQWEDGTTTQQTLRTQTGIYYVRVSLDGCVATDTIQLYFDPIPSFRLGKDTSICIGQPFTLTPLLNTTARYLWQDGSTGPSMQVSREGTYTLTASNHCGQYTDALEVTEGLCRLIMPNTFTPNNDGINDIFRVKYPYPVQQFSFMIYNRYGQMIFETNNTGKGWDGTYLSAPQSTGAYTWIIRITNRDGSREQQSGTVLLVR